MNNKNKSKFVIILKKKYILILLFNTLLFKQPYLKNKNKKVYTLLFVMHFLFKFGLLNLSDLKFKKNSLNNVCL